MRHLNRVKKLNRTKSHRKALLQNLANALFNHEKIKTTNPKAMELKKVADRLITLAKRKDLHSMRLAFGMLRDKEMVRKLFTDIGERYSAINGGYTRVLKIGNRKGDNAPMAIIELTMKKEKAEEKTVKETKAKETTEKKAKAEKAAKTAKKETKTKAEKEAAPKKEKAAKKEPKVKKEDSAEAKEAKPKRTRKKKEETVEAKAEAEVKSEEAKEEDLA